MWSGRRPADAQQRNGFVLLEVLVTAAVAAVLLAVLMRLFSNTWFGVRAVREEADAMVVARNVIAASTPRLNMTAGTQEGTTGRYAWIVAVKPVQAPAPATPQPSPQPQQVAQQTDQQGQGDGNGDGNGGANSGPPWTLFRITVAVRAPSGRRIALETYRLSRPSQ